MVRLFQPFFFLILVITSLPSFSQNQPVEILPGVRKLEFLQLDANTELQILAGNVRLRQGTTIFECDSCVVNNRTNTFEAFGRVHINDSDTAHIYSDYLRYFTDTKLAFFKNRVRMTDGHGTLTTEELEYDVNTKIGTYTKGGRVVNRNTVLTSREGYYYADLRDVYFKNNVVLIDPAYEVRTDSLLYNTQSGVARFIAETNIKDSTGRTIVTREGYYDLRNRKAEFGRRPIVRDGKTFATANDMVSDDSSGIVQMRGNAVLIDMAQGVSVLANEIFINKKTDAFLATRKPLMIVKQDDDSIYIAADTLFSARLSDLPGYDSLSQNNNSNKRDSITKDTIRGTQVLNVNNKDSTNRYFEAFRNVRIFADSMQAVSDSVFYSFRDSTFRLYQGPVVWSQKSQVTGDTIYLYTKNKQAHRMQVFFNSLLVNETEPGVYNQVQSSRMDAFFKEGNIDSVRARGLAKSIYYVQDDDSAYTGINEATSDIMDIYFLNRELQRVVFRSAVKGTLWPMSHKSPSEMRLENFQWHEMRRPKTKFELFE